MKNKHCLLLEKFLIFWQIRTSQHPCSYSTFFFHFLFHDFAEPEIYFTRLHKSDAEWEGERTTSTMLYSFRKRHRNSLRIWPETPWMLQGHQENTSLLRVSLAGPVGPHSICRFIALAFCHFKWLHIILYLRSLAFSLHPFPAYLFPWLKGQVLVVYDLAPKCSSKLMGWGTSWENVSPKAAPAPFPRVL